MFLGPGEVIAHHVGDSDRRGRLLDPGCSRARSRAPLTRLDLRLPPVEHCDAIGIGVIVRCADRGGEVLLIAEVASRDPPAELRAFAVAEV